MSQYKAFISYRHADNRQQGRQWATWLHQAIETYEIPKELVGTKNNRGEVIPERIFPVFRDEEELPADADLATAIISALDNSEILIVLCSPNAVDSTYVDDEIEHFKKIRRSHRIVAAIIDGEPNCSTDKAKQAQGININDECFPKPLRYIYDNEGNSTTELAEPLAADFRVNENGEMMQGWTSSEAYRHHLKATSKLSTKDIDSRVHRYQKQLDKALLKIISCILAIPLRELTQREKEYQLAIANQKAKRLRQWLSALLVLAAIAMALAVFAFSQQQVAEAHKQRALAQTKALLNNKSLDIPRVERELGIGEAIKFAYATMQDNINAVPESYSRYLNFAYQRSETLDKALDDVEINVPFSWRNGTYLKTPSGLLKLSSNSAQRYYQNGNDVLFIDDLRQFIYYHANTNEVSRVDMQNYEVLQADFFDAEYLAQTDSDVIYKYNNLLIFKTTYITTSFRYEERIAIFDIENIKLDSVSQHNYRFAPTKVPSCEEFTVQNEAHLQAILEFNVTCLMALDSFAIDALYYPYLAKESKQWFKETLVLSDDKSSNSLANNLTNKLIKQEQKIPNKEMLEKIFVESGLGDIAFNRQLLKTEDGYTLVFNTAEGKFLGTSICKLDKNGQLDEQFVDEAYISLVAGCLLETQSMNAESFLLRLSKLLFIVTDVEVNETPFQIWDLEARKEITPDAFPLAIARYADSPIFSFTNPETGFALVGLEGNIWLYSFSIGSTVTLDKTINNFNNQRITSLHFIDSSKLLIATEGNAIHLYDINTNDIAWSQQLFKQEQLTKFPDEQPFTPFEPFTRTNILADNVVLSPNKTVGLKMNQGKFQLFDVSNGAKLSGVFNIFEHLAQDPLMGETHYITDLSLDDNGALSFSVYAESDTKQRIKFARTVPSYDLSDSKLFSAYSAYEFIQVYRKLATLPFSLPIKETEIFHDYGAIVGQELEGVTTIEDNGYQETSINNDDLPQLTDEQWCLQFGSFSTRQGAIALRDKLAQIADGIFVHNLGENHQVLLGPKAHQSDFQTVEQQLTDKNVNYWLRSCPNSKQTAIEKPEKKDWLWPFDEAYYFDFDISKGYLELFTKNSSSVEAASDGEVVYIGDGLSGYENLIIIEHNEHYMTAYHHNDRILVQEGQFVRKGQIISEAKHTANYPMLRFEIRYKGKRVNPFDVID